MPAAPLTALSDQIADAVAIAAPFVVQVQGRRRPASGVVYSPDTVVTTTRAIGREDGLSVRAPDGREIEAELAGWDPATHLVVLRAPGLDAPAAAPAAAPARVGHLALAIARSWSNAVTASAGIVSVIGGPLPTGRGRAIDQIIRTTAPMHHGFAGGAFVDVEGRLLGVATAAEIRGLGVVIPAAIAWATAADLVAHGHAKRGYVGVACQGVTLPPDQRGDVGERAVVVVHVMPESPAARAGILVGDVITKLDDVPIESPQHLFEALHGLGGRTSALRILRGAAASTVSVTLADTPPRPR
jgi:S1-C subfamily serine protease